MRKTIVTDVEYRVEREMVPLSVRPITSEGYGPGPQSQQLIMRVMDEGGLVMQYEFVVVSAEIRAEPATEHDRRRLRWLRDDLAVFEEHGLVAGEDDS